MLNRSEGDLWTFPPTAQEKDPMARRIKQIKKKSKKGYFSLLSKNGARRLIYSRPHDLLGGILRYYYITVDAMNDWRELLFARFGSAFVRTRYEGHGNLYDCKTSPFPRVFFFEHGPCVGRIISLHQRQGAWHQTRSLREVYMDKTASARCKVRETERGNLVERRVKYVISYSRPLPTTR